MSEFLDTINRTKVPPDLLAEVMARYAGMVPSERGSFEARALELIQLLDAKGFSEERKADLLLAIQFRMEALAHCALDSAAEGWTLPGMETGQVLMHADLIKAAAEMPLVEDHLKRVVFDYAGLKERTLLLVRPDGRA